MDGNSSYERRIYQLIINEVTERSSCNIYIRSGGGINCEEKISEKGTPESFERCAGEIRTLSL